MAEEDELKTLNEEIGLRESAGDAGYFDAVLAPAFAIRRAGGAVEDRAQFLAKVAESGARTTEISAVDILGNRALVLCTVTMPVDGVPRRFDNLRVLVRGSRTEPWQILAWANEPRLD